MERDSGADPNVTLKIPRPLYERLKQVIEGTGFHSVTEFAVYVLRDLVSHHAPDAPLPDPAARRESQVSDSGEVEPLNPEEIEAIRKRLQSLGYL